MFIGLAWVQNEYDTLILSYGSAFSEKYKLKDFLITKGFNNEYALLHP